MYLPGLSRYCHLLRDQLRPSGEGRRLDRKKENQLKWKQNLSVHNPPSISPQSCGRVWRACTSWGSPRREPGTRGRRETSQKQSSRSRAVKEGAAPADGSWEGSGGSVFRERCLEWLGFRQAVWGEWWGKWKLQLAQTRKALLPIQGALMSSSGQWEPAEEGHSLLHA